MIESYFFGFGTVYIELLLGVYGIQAKWPISTQFKKSIWKDEKSACADVLNSFSSDQMHNVLSISTLRMAIQKCIFIFREELNALGFKPNLYDLFLQKNYDKRYVFPWYSIIKDYSRIWHEHIHVGCTEIANMTFNHWM